MPTVRVLVLVTHDKMAVLIEYALDNVRDDMIENPHIIEALRVLRVKGYRCMIGNVWNAAVDDLRTRPRSAGFALTATACWAGSRSPSSTGSC